MLGSGLIPFFITTLLLFDISANCTSYIPNYTTINPDFQSEIRKNGSNPERVVPVALSKLDLIREITVDNVVNRLIFRLDVILDILDLALEFALIIVGGGELGDPAQGGARARLPRH